jgi:bifunctional DNA-binding transcriptional regulator/antitoxin component of YhaV-PrlF toxin-antitoxin module
MTAWTTTIPKDVNGDAILVIPPEALEILGWVAGDTVEFTVAEDGAITINKVSDAP